jgi:hypothetical protein
MLISVLLGFCYVFGLLGLSLKYNEEMAAFAEYLQKLFPFWWPLTIVLIVLGSLITLSVLSGSV